MRFVHKQVPVKPGESLTVPDGDVLSGTHLEGDGKGGFLVIVHVLARADAIELVGGAFDPNTKGN